MPLFFCTVTLGPDPRVRGYKLAVVAMDARIKSGHDK